MYSIVTHSGYVVDAVWQKNSVQYLPKSTQIGHPLVGRCIVYR